jgi:hypothetical protein
MRRSLVGVLAVVALGVAGCSSEPEAERDDTGAVASEGAVDAFQVALGDCVVDPATGSTETQEVQSVTAVPCDQPHDGEVYSVFDLPDGEFPGEEAVTSQSEERCLADFEGFVGTPYEESRYELSSLFPTKESWDTRDDREVVCIVVGPAGEKLTGSVKGAGD